MTNYTLIAHKPESDDYCMGCHMESYYSDFKIHTQLTRYELIQKWANFAATELDKNEAGYDITVLTSIEGFTFALYSDDNLYEGSVKIPDYIIDSAEYEKLEEEFEEIRLEVGDLRAKIVEERKAQKEKEEAESKTKEAENARLWKLEQLAKLKAEFPDA